MRSKEAKKSPWTADWTIPNLLENSGVCFLNAQNQITKGAIDVITTTLHSGIIWGIHHVDCDGLPPHFRIIAGENRIQLNVTWPDNVTRSSLWLNHGKARCGRFTGNVSGLFFGDLLAWMRAHGLFQVVTNAMVLFALVFLAVLFEWGCGFLQCDGVNPIGGLQRVLVSLNRKIIKVRQAQFFITTKDVLQTIHLWKEAFSLDYCASSLRMEKLLS